MTCHFLPGTASLVDELDKRLLVVLRDGKTVIGYLRTIDQFANLVLQDTIERIHVGKRYGDIPRGIFIIRGENVVLLGEVDNAKESLSDLEEVSVSEILEIQRLEQQREVQKNKERKERGLPMHVSDMVLDD